MVLMTSAVEEGGLRVAVPPEGEPPPRHRRRASSSTINIVTATCSPAQFKAASSIVIVTVIPSLTSPHRLLRLGGSRWRGGVVRWW